jgi:pimeloyl-ACP methyl ester carboxylesterase
MYGDPAGDAAHFVWEEAPAQYASAVIESITGHWP